MFSVMLVTLVLAQCPNGQCQKMPGGVLMDPRLFQALPALPEGPVAAEAYHGGRIESLEQRQYLVQQRAAARAAMRKQYVAYYNVAGYAPTYFWTPPHPSGLYTLPPVYPHN